MFSNEDFETMGTFLERVYGRQKIDEKNNIEDISLAFQKTFSTEVAEKLIEDLNRIFIFDALIGNCDRNEKNYGLIIRENKAIFAPLYDNDSMLSEFGIYDGDYSLEVKRSDYQNQKTNSINLLYEYLDQGEKQQKLFH